MTIEVIAEGGETTIEVEVQVSTRFDDAEERISGSVKLNSSDLEFVFDAGGNQTVGMRFNQLAVPQVATILNAYVQFQTDETSSEATSLAIQGEAVDDAVTFASTDGNITSRPRTNAAAAWSPPPWTIRDERGPNTRLRKVSRSWLGR